MPAALGADCGPFPRPWDGVSDADLARWRIEWTSFGLCERAARERGREDLAAQLRARGGE